MPCHRLNDSHTGLCNNVNKTSLQTLNITVRLQRLWLEYHFTNLKKSKCKGLQLHTIRCGNHMDGWQLCARLCTCPQIFAVSDSVQILQITKVLLMRLQTQVSCVSTHAKRPHIHFEDLVIHVRVWWIVETLKISITQHVPKDMHVKRSESAQEWRIVWSIIIILWFSGQQAMGRTFHGCHRPSDGIL